MSAAGRDWIEGNNRYLAESLRWLRARLQLRLQPPPAGLAEAAANVTPAGRRAWFELGRTASGTLPATPPLLIADASGDEQSAAAGRAAAAAELDPPPALLMLAERLGLTPFERDILLLCAAPELEPAIAELFGPRGGGGGGQGRPGPSFALALHSLEDPSWDALSPHRPLRYARLVEVGQAGAPALTLAPLRVDERILHYLKGLNALDERLADLLTPPPEGEGSPLSPSQREVADAVLAQLRASGGAAQLPPVVLIGNDAGSQKDVARHVAAALGRRLYAVPIGGLPSAPADLEPIVRIWQRERLLLPTALFVDGHDLAGASPEQLRAFYALVGRDIGPAFIGLREAPGRGLGGALVFEVGRPAAAEQHEAWLDALGGEDADAAGRLAGHFDLGLRDIRAASAFAAAADEAEDPRAEPRLWAAARRLVQPRLGQLAEQIEPKAGWDDIVLTDEAETLLRRIAEQARHRYRVYEEWGYAARMTRGLGISALFAGESGTGKTMAAEVIARDLDLGLYRIDLSAVVSKYIGETEKNLSRMFDAAEQGGAILLFDEADALFGKRSEVKDSHDRYANIEINYLLQRIESFRGLAILATNMKSALDTAFLRRLRFIVNFPYPSPAERARMWRRALPEDLPREELDFDRLARFALSGGNIHSIALNASFMAAAKGVPLSQSLLVAAVRTELKKLDKQVNEAEFR